jgi:hypothetical protein
VWEKVVFPISNLEQALIPYKIILLGSPPQKLAQGVSEDYPNLIRTSIVLSQYTS